MCDFPNREAAMVITHRMPDGTPDAWCDPCLVPIVAALNDSGVRTVASCCGHGRRPGSVILADDRWLLIGTREQMARTADLWPGINDQREPSATGLVGAGALGEDYLVLDRVIDAIHHCRRQGWTEASDHFDRVLRAALGGDEGGGA